MGDFALEKLTPGSKVTAWLPVAPRADGKQWELPVLAAKGAQDGPMLVVLAAVHGDEYEGIEAIPLAFGDVDPAHLSGTLVMVPICNLPAYEAAQRSSPIDGLNLARVFPGKGDGTITERIAYALTEQLFRHADFLLDLHSGGVAADIPTLIGYLHDDGELGQRSRAAAEAFGAPVLWGHPMPVPAGRSISAAMALGVPWLYTEAPGGGFARPDDVACFRRGILNVMHHLGMVAGAPEAPEPRAHLVGDGNLDIVTLAPCGGYFRAQAKVLDRVSRGDRLGTIVDFFGSPCAEISAEMDGVVIMVRRVHRVHVGDGLVQVTNTLDDYLSGKL
jgi:predicted deacylase